MKTLTQAQAQRMVDELNYRINWGKDTGTLNQKLIAGGWDVKFDESDDPDTTFVLDLDAEFEDEGEETDEEDEDESEEDD